MKIKNRYLRNRAFHDKIWKRVRNIEHPFETYMPYPNLSWATEVEDQIRRNFEYIEERSRLMENGCHSGRLNASSEYRRILNHKRRAKIKNALDKINNGNYEIEVPFFKKDANWNWF